MHKKDILEILVPAVSILSALAFIMLVEEKKRRRMAQRIARITRPRNARQKNVDVVSLRKSRESGLPFIGNALLHVTKMSALSMRLERAGLTIAPDMYIGMCAGIGVGTTGIMTLLHKSPALAVFFGLFLGVAVPYGIIIRKGNQRIKKFLTLFPDAIDFIVRGLRSGLPATESMNMVGQEMEEPVGSIFRNIGESVRLGVPVEKALSDTAKKLGTTEFNFFVTSIIMQRETGGNLSEILGNLSEVLRRRFMMRMKIKAMSSEAKASAIIVGALPFIVILALTFIAPGYLDPLIDDRRGNIAAGGAALMMLAGIGIMMKMTRFEI